MLILTASSMYAQEHKKKRSVKYTIEVDGVCEMCKKRIEKACLDSKGVKYASWNIDTHQLILILNERKTSIKEVKQNIAKAGHDTKSVKATDEAYAQLHYCCQYRDE